MERQAAALNLLRRAGYRASAYGDNSVVVRTPSGLVVIPLV